MQDIRKDLWGVHETGGVVCITTNGFVTRRGRAVMGRGVAAQAAYRWRTLARRLGELILENGHIVQIVGERLVSFPVKPASGISDGQNIVSASQYQFGVGVKVPGWAMKADLGLIRESLRQLDQLRQRQGWRRVYLPRPGCGAGERDWEAEVKPLCESYGDWLIIVYI